MTRSVCGDFVPRRLAVCLIDSSQRQLVMYYRLYSVSSTMLCEMLLGCQSHVGAFPSPVVVPRQRCRLLSRRQMLDGGSLRKRRGKALNAASMEVSLAKDIYCAEPWWSRNPTPNMITIASPAELLNALVCFLGQRGKADGVLCSKSLEIDWS